MKVKIISLAVAAAVSLSACNSGGSSNSDDGFDSTAIKTSKSVTLSSTATTSKAAASGGGQQGGISSFLVQSIFGTFAMGTLGFPGTWAASMLSSILFSWLPQQEDQTTVMLKEINEKLTVVLDGLKTNLNLTASVQDITAAVYTLLSQQGVTDSFTKFDDAITYVNSEYQTYLDNNIFDSNESGNLSSMYTYAQNHCNDVAITTVLEASDDSRPDNQYKQFKSAFINSDSTVGASSTYQKVVNAKTNYKQAIVATLPKNADFMKYINEYNFDITYYRWKTAGNFQKLYAMQMAQLAYHYACGNTITFTNLGNLPAGTGESGFNLGVELLNEKYKTDFKQLEGNMETYMPVISNSEIYTLISTNFSSSLLDSSSFNVGESTVGACSLSQLYFNSKTTDGQTAGIINMQGLCIASKTGSESNIKYESATISLEIPYHTSNNTSFDRIGQSNLKYDVTSKDLSSTVSTDGMDSSDVYNIFNLKPEMAFNGYYWKNNVESWNILAPTEGQMWGGFNVSLNNGVQLYDDEYQDINGAYNYERDCGGTYSNSIPDYTNTSSITFVSSGIQRYYQAVTGSGDYGNCGALGTQMGWEYWDLADYHGKTFALKLAFQHYGSASGLMHKYGVVPTDHQSNHNGMQVIGIYCLTSACSRQDDGMGQNDNKTTLTWTDGTQVTIDTDENMDDTVKTGSYLYKTSIDGSITK